MIRGEERRAMLETQAINLIGEYGLPYPEHRLVNSAEEAAEFAEMIKGPVVLKIVSPDVLHKSDVGGVMTGIPDATSAAQGYGALIKRVQGKGQLINIKGVLVCRQAEPGLEVIIGGLRDPTFGPTVMFGLGGVFTEVLKDVSFRIAPIEMIDAEEMMNEIKGRALLDGYRDQPAISREKLSETLRTVGRLMMERDDVSELDLNPVRLYSNSLLILDARIIKRDVRQN